MLRKIVNMFKMNRHCVGQIRVAQYPICPKTGAVLLHRPENVFVKKNLVLYGGADVLARLAAGDAEYKINAMYFEFENGSPGSVSIPTFTRAGGIAYYRALLNPKDYLRVPMSINASILSSDTTLYDGNQATFFSLTSGTTGALGRTFNAAVGSTVYGVGLAATPTIGQPTQDIVFARAYFDGTLFPKVSGKAVGTEWGIKFS